ncbi:MAG: hypothetical protein ACP5QT_03705 [Brevinematia bacterium]
MKRFFILLIALAFFVIGACEKKEKTPSEKDLVAELLKENLLGTNTSTNIVMDEEITEKVSNTNVVSESQKVGELSASSTSVVEVEEKPKIADEGIEVKPSKKIASQKAGSYIIIGNDKSGQSVSPRKFLKLTFAVVVKSEKASSVDFYVYAIPKGKEKPRFLISSVKNIKVINGQAQLTKYWNARKTDGDFLEVGEYNIFVRFDVKDEDGDILNKIERYWGNKDFYLKIY